MKVAVVGAGPSGLSALKESLAAGFEVDCFEALPHIGGQWAYCEPDSKTGEVYSSVYQGLLLNSCRDTSAFGDFPLDPARYPVYFTHPLFLQYINEFADFWDLRPHIQLNTKVLKCEQLEDGRWKVQRQTTGQDPVEGIYDALLACNGKNYFTHTPHFPGKDSFEGQWLHSHYYRNPKPFIGKRITIIGLGASAVDIACELAPHAEVHMITRRGGWILPRFALGKPAEAFASRFGETVLPESIAQWAYMFLMNTVQGVHPPELKPEHGILANSPTIRGEFLERVNVGQIKIHRASVSAIKPTGVSLSTGETVESDVVICCTGYNIELPYLPSNILSLPPDELKPTTNEYKTLDLLNLIKPVHHPNLFIVGLADAAGPAFPVIEAQTRWSIGVLNGKIKLPPPQKQVDEIRKFQAHQLKKFVHSDRHAGMVHFMPYIDSLLAELGAKPTLGKLLGYTAKHPLQGLSLLNAVYMKIPASAQWRLFGDGNCTDWAAESVLRVCNEKKEMTKKEKEELEKMRKGFVAKGYDEVNRNGNAEVTKDGHGQESGTVNGTVNGDADKTATHANGSTAGKVNGHAEESI